MPGCHKLGQIADRGTIAAEQIANDELSSAFLSVSFWHQMFLLSLRDAGQVNFKISDYWLLGPSGTSSAPASQVLQMCVPSGTGTRLPPQGDWICNAECVLSKDEGWVFDEKISKSLQKC